MSNMGKCDYKDCEKNAARHLSTHHFCDEHNRKLRKKAVENEPDSLYDWVKEVIQSDSDKLDLD